MDKRRAIQIMTRAAELYKDNLENQKILFLYGTPAEVRKQMEKDDKDLSCLNVPNTLLKKDIRDVTKQPTYKVFAVLSKHYSDEKYSCISKIDKSIDLQACFFSDEIEQMIVRC